MLHLLQLHFPGRVALGLAVVLALLRDVRRVLVVLLLLFLVRLGEIRLVLLEDLALDDLALGHDIDARIRVDALVRDLRAAPREDKLTGAHWIAAREDRDGLREPLGRRIHRHGGCDGLCSVGVVLVVVPLLLPDGEHRVEVDRRDGQAVLPARGKLGELRSRVLERLEDRRHLLPRVLVRLLVGGVLAAFLDAGDDLIERVLAQRETLREVRALGPADLNTDRLERSELAELDVRERRGRERPLLVDDREPADLSIERRDQRRDQIERCADERIDLELGALTGRKPSLDVGT